jgi:hypothetical protein
MSREREGIEETSTNEITNSHIRNFAFKHVSINFSAFISSLSNLIMKRNDGLFRFFHVIKSIDLWKVIYEIINQQVKNNCKNLVD